MDISTKTINSMRAIALDSINRAQQGHIGMAIGAAPISYALIGQLLNFSSTNPQWINRDRFVLSAGHGSMVYYSIMHFLGLLSVDDMKKHKTLGSKTPSHPEHDAFAYVDASTGPLGQGIAMAVGMALSQKYLQNKFNKPGLKIIDHSIYALHGDGCLQEGVALEALALAGTLQLQDLILIHDYNQVQIDSTSQEVNNVDFKKFFEALNFKVIIVPDADPKNITAALTAAKKSTKPTYIQVSTVIAYGTKISGQSKAHNGVLNQQDTRDFKINLGLKNTADFKYDQDVYEHGKTLMNKKNEAYQKWKVLALKYQKSYRQEYQLLFDIYHQKINNDISDVTFVETNVATRNYIGTIMRALEDMPNIIGGSADLAGATRVKFAKDLLDGGKNIKYGIREFAMVAINNGIYLHAHLRTVDATFLAFADYAKSAYRLGAIQHIPAIHVLTHDSYQVGGDGPTHQPVEQLAMLRAMNNFIVIRPADGTEMKKAFQYALNINDQTCAIIGCRQPLKSFDVLSGKMVGAYVIKQVDHFDISLLASGSEVMLAAKVQQALLQYSIKAQVISVPILQNLVDNDQLIEKLQLKQKPMFAIEASSDALWYKLARYQKFDGFFAFGYGYSAPGQVVYEKMGFEVKKITKKVLKFLKS